jgi:inner membrane protein
MDNITHTLTAVAISHAGFIRKTRFATAAVVVAANLPDIDIIWGRMGTIDYIKYHRGITHSILGGIVLGFLTGLIAYELGRHLRPSKKPMPPVSRKWLVLACLAGCASHLLLDFTNAYGIRPFLPFSARWYAWDIMFIVDPLLIGLLMLALGVPALMRLVSEEMGARGHSKMHGAIAASCCLLGLWGLRDVCHRRAIHMMEGRTYGQEGAWNLGAFPTAMNPFSWNGVVETPSSLLMLPVDTLATNVDAENAESFPKAEASPLFNAAMKTRTMQIFMDFARFPWGEVFPGDDGGMVRVRDLRFASPGNVRTGFMVTITLDKNLQPVSETFGRGYRHGND